MLLHPPAEVTEWPGSITWFDEEGILYSISKSSVRTSVEQTKKTIEAFKVYLEGKKVCMLIDVSATTESSKEARDYAAQELPNFVKAIAMVSESALGIMLANLFFTLKSQPYPTKMFKDVEEAKSWLRQYL